MTVLRTATTVTEDKAWEAVTAPLLADCLLARYGGKLQPANQHADSAKTARTLTRKRNWRRFGLANGRPYMLMPFPTATAFCTGRCSACPAST
ncbi:hypothetical protein NRY67_15550 [Acidithiobacillus ferrooxidans]|uniref:hypothetical protein n=1 Tax=Acidithiobacillus ferrooxidans TaxID=920 RepID=UPI000A4DE4BA|nr:hypothetical protein [Acidithiobacillus ferrooxidans]MCR1343991.1 hypothetical protein [Acidithiobacillus ferrooxidans]